MLLPTQSQGKMQLDIVQQTVMTPSTNRVSQSWLFQSTVRSYINEKVSGSDRCTGHKDKCSIGKIVKQNLFNSIGEILKVWTVARCLCF